MFFDAFDDTESGYSLELSHTLDESNRLVIDFPMISSQVEQEFDQTLLPV